MSLRPKPAARRPRATETILFATQTSETANLAISNNEVIAPELKTQGCRCASGDVTAFKVGGGLGGTLRLYLRFVPTVCSAALRFINGQQDRQYQHE